MADKKIKKVKVKNAKKKLMEALVEIQAAHEGVMRPSREDRRALHVTRRVEFLLRAAEQRMRRLDHWMQEEGEEE